MITPKPLKRGDKVGIVSPSGKIGKGALDDAVTRIEGWGFNVVTSPEAYYEFNQFAGTDTQRTLGLQAMLDDPEVRAVICSRGGYGAVRIIDNIDFRLFVASPKWIVGYSDITVLHGHINENLNIETIHGPMAAEFSPAGNSPASERSLELLREALSGTLSASYFPNHKLSRKGKAEGVMTGGNLSVLYSLTGSPSFPDMRGKILFIEDVGEYLYHIDRMMNALHRSGLLGEIGGLVVGGMTNMDDNKVPFGRTAEEIISGAVEEYDYPVCFGFPAGHQPDNQPLIMGHEVVVSVGESTSSLTFVQ